MKKIILILGIIFLLIGVSIVSSTDNRVKDNPTTINISKSLEVTKYVKSDEMIAYAYILYSGSSGHPEGPCYFYLDDPGTLYSIGDESHYKVFSGGTWTTDDQWLLCDNVNLWEIDPETGSIAAIGGQGGNGLAWDPVYDRLYGTDKRGKWLFEYDPETGEQDYIGSHNQPDKTMIGLAINSEGICYAWDALYNGNSTLYTVDLETGEATEYAGFRQPLVYAQDGAFDWDTSILWFTAYYNYSYSFLAYWDFDTDEFIEVGTFEGDAELATCAIPYGIIARFTWIPAHPNPNETILFNASKSYAHYNTITLYEWDWDNDGIFDENHTEPITTHSWSEEGKYLVTLRVTDNTSLTGMKTKTVRVYNQPPETPIVDGPAHGKPGIDYNYTFVSTDQDGDDIWYHISWGDKEIIYIYGPYPSGEEITLSYNWSEKGTFVISCWARDIYDSISNVSTLKVTMPRDKSTSISPLLRFLERYPLLNLLLQKLTFL